MAPCGNPCLVGLKSTQSDRQASRAKRFMVAKLVEISAIIERLAFFNSFTADEKQQLASEDAHFKVYAPGELLIRQGSSDQSLFIILTGTVAVTESAGGTVLAVLQAGDIFGEMALLTDMRRTANVAAREAVIALKLDRMLFDQLTPEVREKFKDKIIEKLVARLDTANKELSRLHAVVTNEPQNVSIPLSGPLPGDGHPPVFESGRDLIRTIVSHTESLPAMPEVMLRVQKLIKHPSTSPFQLAKIIETDPSIVAGILKIANSAYYGFRGKVSTIQHASSLFGTRRLAELITAMSAGGVLGRAMDGYGLKAGDMWRHAIMVASAASQIAVELKTDLLDSAYMAGLLHDMGKIILDPHVRERRLLFEHYFAANPGKSIQDAERDILGFDHAVIAAILCEKWSLPKTITFAIRNHHHPSEAGDHPLSHIVHLADYVCAQDTPAKNGTPAVKMLDETTRTAVPLDTDALRTVVKKARQYTQSLTGRMANR